MSRFDGVRSLRTNATALQTRTFPSTVPSMMAEQAIVMAVTCQALYGSSQASHPSVSNDAAASTSPPAAAAVVRLPLQSPPPPGPPLPSLPFSDFVCRSIVVGDNPTTRTSLSPPPQLASPAPPPPAPWEVSRDRMLPRDDAGSRSTTTEEASKNSFDSPAPDDDASGILKRFIRRAVIDVFQADGVQSMIRKDGFLLRRGGLSSFNRACHFDLSPISPSCARLPRSTFLIYRFSRLAVILDAAPAMWCFQESINTASPLSVLSLKSVPLTVIRRRSVALPATSGYWK